MPKCIKKRFAKKWDESFEIQNSKFEIGIFVVIKQPRCEFEEYLRPYVGKKGTISEEMSIGLNSLCLKFDSDFLNQNVMVPEDLIQNFEDYVNSFSTEELLTTEDEELRRIGSQQIGTLQVIQD
jgi:hypothetical protein